MAAKEEAATAPPLAATPTSNGFWSGRMHHEPAVHSRCNTLLGAGQGIMAATAKKTEHQRSLLLPPLLPIGLGLVRCTMSLQSAVSTTPCWARDRASWQQQRHLLVSPILPIMNEIWSGKMHHEPAVRCEYITLLGAGQGIMAATASPPGITHTSNEIWSGKMHHEPAVRCEYHTLLGAGQGIMAATASPPVRCEYITLLGAGQGIMAATGSPPGITHTSNEIWSGKMHHEPAVRCEYHTLLGAGQGMMAATITL
eukprot:gene15116-21173_t